MGVQNDVQQANAEAACGLCRAATVEAAQRIAPQKRSLLCPLSERRCRHPLLFAVLDLLVLLDQAKSTRKESVRKNFPINFSGIIPSQCLGDFLRGATLPPFVTKRWRQKCPQGTFVGIGRRFSLSGHKRLRCFARPLRALEPPSDLIPPPVQCGICGALRATMIICWSPVLTGLRPAGSHCESSG